MSSLLSENAIAGSKTDRVKSLFDVTEKYLAPRRFDIQVRIETVQAFTEAMHFDNILDVGCGDGSISIPLLPRCQRLTLVDLSPNMLDLARQKIPAARSKDLEMLDGDLLKAPLDLMSFDLVICLGVLAHVESPSAVIARLAELAKPGGTVLLEFTDSFHPWGLQVVAYRRLLKLMRPEPYALNRLKMRTVLDLCAKNHFTVSRLYRYGLPPTGSQWVMNQEQMHRWVQRMFGTADTAKKQWLGNQFIYRLERH